MKRHHGNMPGFAPVESPRATACERHDMIPVEIVAAQAAVPLTSIDERLMRPVQRIRLQPGIFMTMPAPVDIRQGHWHTLMLEMAGNAELRMQGITGFLKARLVEAEHGMTLLRKIMASQTLAVSRWLPGTGRWQLSQARSSCPLVSGPRACQASWPGRKSRKSATAPVKRPSISPRFWRKRLAIQAGTLPFSCRL